ncbi:unnamed protein product, partial [Urochloa humidicola]
RQAPEEAFFLLSIFLLSICSWQRGRGEEEDGARKSVRSSVSLAPVMAGSVRGGMRRSARRKTAGMERSSSDSTFGARRIPESCTRLKILWTQGILSHVSLLI